VQTLLTKGIRVVTIGPGEHHVGRGDEVIKTLLGSCVAVCLFDTVAAVGGMNHFLLASDRRRPNQNTARAGFYGASAMKLLLDAVLRRGAVRERLQAKVFGGANVLKNPRGRENNLYDIGNANVDFALRFLATAGIPVIAQDVRGTHGRVIHLDPADFSVYRNLIDLEQDPGVVSEEQRYLATAQEPLSRGVNVRTVGARGASQDSNQHVLARAPGEPNGHGVPLSPPTDKKGGQAFSRGKGPARPPTAQRRATADEDTRDSPTRPAAGQESEGGSP